MGMQITLKSSAFHEKRAVNCDCHLYFHFHAHWAEKVVDQHDTGCCALSSAFMDLP